MLNVIYFFKSSAPCKEGNLRDVGEVPTHKFNRRCWNVTWFG